LQGEHLRGLKPAHLLVWRKHEHANAVLAAHGVFGAGAGIAGGRAQDIEVTVGFKQSVLEQITEQLQGNVLERQGWAV